MAHQKISKTLQSRTLLICAGLFLTVSLPSSAARADGIPVHDPTTYAKLAEVGTTIKNVADTVKETLDTLNAFKDLFQSKMDQLISAVVAAGQANVTATQVSAEVNARAHDVSDNNHTLDAKDQVFAQVAAEHTPPPDANWLCLKIKSKQALLVLEQFREAVQLGLMGAAKQGLGAGKDAFGPQGARENWYALCGNVDGVKKMSSLTGPTDCQATDPSVADAFLTQGTGLTYPMRLPKISIQDGAAVMVVDQSDVTQQRWSSVRDGFYLAMQHPSPPRGELLKTSAGMAAMTEFMRQFARQSEMGSPLAAKIAFNTMMNCSDSGFSSECAIVKDGCQAAKKAIKFDAADCDKGVSYGQQLYLDTAMSASDNNSKFMAAAGSRHGQIAAANDVTGLEIIQAATLKATVQMAAAAGATGLSSIDYGTFQKQVRVAENELREMKGEKAYGQNNKQEPEEGMGLKKKAKVQGDDALKEQAHLKAQPIKDAEPSLHSGALEALPAVLNR